MHKIERRSAISKPEGKSLDVESQTIDHAELAAPWKILWQVPALHGLTQK